MQVSRLKRVQAERIPAIAFLLREHGEQPLNGLGDADQAARSCFDPSGLAIRALIGAAVGAGAAMLFQDESMKSGAAWGAGLVLGLHVLGCALHRE